MWNVWLPILVVNGNKLQIIFSEISTEVHGGPPMEEPFLFILLDNGGFNLKNLFQRSYFVSTGTCRSLPLLNDRYLFQCLSVVPQKPHFIHCFFNLTIYTLLSSCRFMCRDRWGQWSAIQSLHLNCPLLAEKHHDRGGSILFPDRL